MESQMEVLYFTAVASFYLEAAAVTNLVTKESILTTTGDDTFTQRVGISLERKFPNKHKATLEQRLAQNLVSLSLAHGKQSIHRCAASLIKPRSSLL